MAGYVKPPRGKKRGLEGEVPRSGLTRRCILVLAAAQYVQVQVVMQFAVGILWMRIMAAMHVARSVGAQSMVCHGCGLAHQPMLVSVLMAIFVLFPTLLPERCCRGRHRPGWTLGGLPFGDGEGGQMPGA